MKLHVVSNAEDATLVADRINLSNIGILAIAPGRQAAEKLLAGIDEEEYGATALIARGRRKTKELLDSLPEPDRAATVIIVPDISMVVGMYPKYRGCIQEEPVRHVIIDFGTYGDQHTVGSGLLMYAGPVLGEIVGFLAIHFPTTMGQQLKHSK